MDLPEHHTVVRLARTQSSALHQISPLGKTNASVTAVAFLRIHLRERGSDDMMAHRDLAYGRAGKRPSQGRGEVGRGARLL